ncbi:uncharacterized protein [Clytia hemisphaerica]|uniref:Uncharacterized protein n=1 Tax=Clytia hemisphaerica TaxID=252671 RepID=A0A7M5WSB3_9CNID
MFSFYCFVFIFGLILFLDLSTVGCESEILGIPPNNHGKEALILIDDAGLNLTMGNLLTKIPLLSPEFVISVNIRIHTSIINTGTMACNIIHLTTGANILEYGSRSPFIGVIENSLKLFVEQGINGADRTGMTIPKILSINKTYHVEVHQRYTSNGNYRYFVKLDGTEVASLVNTDARQFYDIKVYASNPWNAACPVHASNFQITNFL